ncbi:MAG: hypothetical protein LRS49_03315 [Desulfurococcales archaeon]|nr:hypothetical protein [Desulfurococcales archaeon]
MAEPGGGRGNPWRAIPSHRSIGVYTEHGLTPSLLASFMDRAEEAGCRLVYDPFVGSGVVAVYSQDRCMPFAGADSNPWSLVLVKAKTTRLDWRALRGWAERAPLEARQLEPVIPSPRLSEYHDRGALEALGRLRALAEGAPDEWRPLLLAVLARVAYRWSRLRRSPAPRFGRAPPEGGDVYSEYSRLLMRAVGELEARRYCAPVEVFMADSASWMPVRVCGVVTSPPFANNTDYVRHTMLELLWAGIARDSEDLGWVRSLQVPACEAATRSWKPYSRHGWLVELASRVGGSRARGYRRFLLQYFQAMEDHLALLAEALEWEAWYTVGDSVLGGAYIPTHRVLARLAEAHGLQASVEPLSPRYRPGRTLYLLTLRPRR